MENSARFPHLLKADLLAELDPGFKRDFLNKCAARVYSEPTIILEQGQAAASMAMVAHGYVDVLFNGEDGHQLFLARYKAGGTLGETEVISGEPCAATCRTSANATILHCAPKDLAAALQNHGFIRNLTRGFHRRLLYDNWAKHVAQFGSVQDRLCGYLYILSEHSGVVRETQAYLANIVGCSRQTINRELATLREMGLISQSGSEITVKDRKALGDKLF